ncbi:MAG: efflux RND transporter periplasmic adaptor subunit [Balneolaceae bacterium]
MNITNQKILSATGLILAGLLIGRLLFSGPSAQNGDPGQLNREEMNEHVREDHTNEEGDIVYTCSMHPQVRESEPGNCPICGMELIPVSPSAPEAAEDDSSDEYSMVMTAPAARLADIRTTPAVRSVPHKELNLPGRIRVDERRTTRVTTHFSGRIRDLKIDFTGAPVRQGEPVATIYSPELVSAQRELLEAARQKDRNPRLYESVREKFRLWEFTDEQIREIEDRGEVQTELEILSPAGGYVARRNIAEEQHVSEGTVILEVASLDRIWVVLEAYEEDLDWISEGDTFHFTTRSDPGQSYKATVSFIDPVVDSSSRTVGVRADMDNAGGKLKPGMLVRARMESRMDRDELMVPSSSVLWTGKRSLVYVRDTTSEIPRFEARLVELGPRSGDFHVIEDGLEEGEEVVFHGAFRVDSEMQLEGRFSMMNRKPGTDAVPVHDHSDSESGRESDNEFDNEHEEMEDMPVP